MTVRLLIPYAGQGAGTLYTGPDEDYLVGASQADRAIADGKIANPPNPAEKLIAPQAPRKRRIIAFGHSMVDYGRAVASGSHLARGLHTWVRALTRGRIDCDMGDIYATAGADLDTLINSYLSQVVARTDVDVVMVLAVTNTISSKTAATDWDSHILPRLILLRDTLLNAGKTVIWVIDPPRGNAGATSVAVTSTGLRNMLRYRAWVLAQASLPGFIPVDTWPLGADGGPEGYNRPALFADGLHPNQLGAYTIFAKALVPIIDRLFTQRNILPVSNADTISAEQPGGCFTTNPMSLGTTGTITAPAAGTMTGQIATSHTAALANGAGLTVTWSKQIDADGTEWNRAVISGTPTSAGAELSINPPSVGGASFTAGDQLDIVAAVRVAAGQTGINRTSLIVFDGGAALNRVDLDRLTATDTFPTDALDMVLRQRFAVATPGTIGPKVAATFLQNVAVSATIDIRCIAGRKVAG